MIFNSYVKLPEGTVNGMNRGRKLEVRFFHGGLCGFCPTNGGVQLHRSCVAHGSSPTSQSEPNRSWRFSKILHEHYLVGGLEHLFSIQYIGNNNPN